MSHNVIQSQQTSQGFPKEGSSSFSEQRVWGTEPWSDLPKATQDSYGTAKWYIQLWILLQHFIRDQRSSFLTEVSHLFLNVLTVA